MDLERRSIAGAQLRASEGDKPVIEGYAAVFNELSEDMGGWFERIAPGAFDPVLKDDVRGLFNHDQNIILGRTASKTLEISVDERGLAYKITPPQTEMARSVVEAIRRGDVSGSSFAFIADQTKWEELNGVIIRNIIRFRRLYDVSPVSYPAYAQTDVALRSLAEWRKTSPNGGQAAEPPKPNELEEMRARISGLEGENLALREQVRRLQIDLVS
jgi:HK97 family phage prohead protease